MTLRARISVERGQGFTLDIAFEAAAGETIALLGPNGAGKTTALRTLAGLLPLTAGQLAIDGQILDDPAAGVLVAPEHRPVAVMFQDYLLFPHLSVLENVAFGLRACGVDRRVARARAHQWLERMAIGEFASRRPHGLSGGQSQRVALARALVTEPRLLLLDEPLAALDAGTRIQIRAELSRHLAAYDGTTVLVTHDPLDAMVLADRLLVVENGRIVQQGPPREIAEAPRTDYVAQLVGLNLYRGHATGPDVRLPGGATLHSADHAAGDVFVAFAPQAITLHQDRPQGSARNAWPVTVVSVEEYGTITRVSLGGEPDVLADVTPGAVADLNIVPGTRLWAGLKATEVRTYRA